jgi:ubiquinone/menaquinone biosynthesis C-methylase UbiE
MKEWLPRGYSFLAPWYDFTACVCSLGIIPHAQRTLLQALPQRHNLLIVGGGTGSCLRFLPWERMDGLVTFVDVAPGMIRRARHVALTLGVANRVRFLQKPIEQEGGLPAGA